MSTTPTAEPAPVPGGEARPKSGAAGLARHAGIVSFFTMLSRVTGLVRDTAFTHFFGASHATDAFLMAFTIPNTFRQLVAEGSLTVAFLPVFNEAQRARGQEAARVLMAEALAVFPLLSSLLVGGCILLAEPLVGLFAQGFAAVPGKFELTVSLTRWMFPSLAMVSTVALAMGALNAQKRFAAPASAPLIFNIVHTVSMVTLAQSVDPPMLGVSFGVLLGGVAQMVLEAHALHGAGLLVRPRFRLSPEVRRILWLMLPALVSLAVYQINIVILRNFASYLGEGAVTYLYNADRFLQLPLGVFGIAVATASLPSLADAWADGDRPGVVRTFGDSLRLTNFVTIPSAVALGVLALPIMATVFQHGQFTHEMAVNTAWALLASSTGLVAISGIRVAAQVFFAMKDTRTPVACSAVGVAANLAAAPLLAVHYDYVGLALSVSLAAWLQLLVEVVLLRRRLGSLGLGRVGLAAGRDLLAAAVMGGVAFGLARLGAWDHGLSLRNVAVLGLTVASGVAVYGLTQLAMGSSEARLLVGAVSRRVARRRSRK